MNIELKEITVRELTEGYVDNNEDGVIGFGGKLDIRPPFQREFVYKDKQRDAVIKTLRNGFPLNMMYWAVREDGTFEVIDGQQRTISVCQYVKGKFSINGIYYHVLTEDKRAQILDYKFTVYLCSGTDSEKLDWFEIVNIAGEELTSQELRNAVYAGSWVSEAKRYFSKTGCPAYSIGNNYINGSPIRQEYLETAIKWISNNDINEYMGVHHHDPNANELWEYFRKVIKWIESIFTEKRKEMKGVEWGLLYRDYKDETYNTEDIEKKTVELMLDDDVTKKSGIYPYILTGKEKYLSIRAFTENMKRAVYEKQKGKCKICKNWFELNKMEADHITPWHEGGKTIKENCQILCKDDNRKKSGK